MFIPPPEFNWFQLDLHFSVAQTTVLTPLPIQPDLKQSKLAGYPYLPKNELPVSDEKGHPMLLLAQLNFSEIEAPADFPKEGILQFFITQNCYENYTLDNYQKLFKIRYYPALQEDNELTTDFAYLKQANFKDFPIKFEQALATYDRAEPVSATDFRLHQFINSARLNETLPHDGRTLNELYLEHFLSADHKIGGYPYFIEQDIRQQNVQLQQYDTLLLQIISNDAQQIMWGDSGVINFFINSKMLQQLDFSDVFFHAEDYD